jgi:small neutral amino acid transporter SnatA (MarC family)
VRRCAGAVLVGMALALALPGAALATSSPTISAPSATNPFSPGVPQTPAQVPTTTAPTVVQTTATTSGSSTGLSGSSGLIIVVVAVLLLCAISYFIWRDARRRAPVRHRAVEATAGGNRSGSKAKAKARKLSPAERRRRKRGRAR